MQFQMPGCGGGLVVPPSRAMEQLQSRALGVWALEPSRRCIGPAAAAVLQLDLRSFDRADDRAAVSFVLARQAPPFPPDLRPRGSSRGRSSDPSTAAAPAWAQPWHCCGVCVAVSNHPDDSAVEGERAAAPPGHLRREFDLCLPLPTEMANRYDARGASRGVGASSFELFILFCIFCYFYNSATNFSFPT